MAFFTSAITTLQTLVVALGAGLGVWGVVNLLEGYGSDTLAWACGALSICWRATARTTLAPKARV